MPAETTLVRYVGEYCTFTLLQHTGRKRIFVFILNLKRKTHQAWAIASSRSKPQSCAPVAAQFQRVSHWPGETRSIGTGFESSLTSWVAPTRLRARV